MSSDLFNNESEWFQTVLIEDVACKKKYEVTITSDPKFTIGSETNISSNSNSASGTYGNNFSLYGQSITIDGTLKAPGVTIGATVLSATSNGKIVTSGNNGTDESEHPTTKGNGKNGGNGYNAGEICIFSQELINNQITLSMYADGGNGGAGQKSFDGNGGDGGDGGDGGTVIFICYTKDLIPANFLNTMKGGFSFDNLQSFSEYCKQVKNSNIAAAAQKVETAWKKYNDDQNQLPFMEAISNLDTVTREMVNTWKVNNIYPNISNVAGEYGVYGSGNTVKKDGKSGKNGKSNGKKEVIAIGLPGDFARQSINCIPVHPVQSKMVQSRIEMLYFVADPVTENMSDLALLCKQLIDQTAFANYVNDESVMAKLYKNKSYEIGSLGGISSLRQINQRATLLLSQMKQGLDYYGHDDHYTPLISFSLSSKFFDKLLTDFGIIEDYYNKYFLALKKQNKDKKSISNLIDQSDSIKKSAENQLEDCKLMANKTLNSIILATPIVKKKKDEMNVAISNFKNDLSSKLNWNIDDLLNALSTVAFCPKSKAMIVTQTINVLNEAKSTLETPEGTDINKQYIVHQINTFKNTIGGLKESFSQLNNGELAADDPGAGKLITEEVTFENFMAQHVNSKMLDKKYDNVKKAINNYVKTITARNTQILYYNAIITEQIDLAQSIEQLTKILDSKNILALQECQFNYPDLVSFMSNAYLQSRAQIIRALYNVSKSFQFWSLSNKNLLATSFPTDADLSNPPTINYATLTSAKSNMISSYMSSLEQKYYRQSFSNLCYYLSATEMQLLAELNQTIVYFDPVYSATTSIESIFTLMYDVRIETARPMLILTEEAKKRNDLIHISITQMGREKIIDGDDNLFTFEHDPVHSLFIYYPINPEEPKQPNIISDATFGQKVSLMQNQNFALIGPFAQWIISIPQADNPNLNIKTDVVGIRWEFSGTYYPFS